MGRFGNGNVTHFHSNNSSETISKIKKKGPCEIHVEEIRYVEKGSIERLNVRMIHNSKEISENKDAKERIEPQRFCKTDVTRKDQRSIETCGRRK